MPAPGYLMHQPIVFDSISGTVGTLAGSVMSGTIGVYEGTITSQIFGTVVGGILVKARALSQLMGVGIARFSEDTGSIIGFSVFDFGKHLGSMTGSFMGTVTADSNHILIKAFSAGTVATAGYLPAKELPVGAIVVGTIVFIEQGT